MITLDNVDKYIYKDLKELKDIHYINALRDEQKVDIGKPTIRFILIWILISAPIIFIFVYSNLPPTASEIGATMSVQAKTPAEDCNDDNGETTCSTGIQKNPFFVMEYSCQIVIKKVEAKLLKTAPKAYKSQMVVTVTNSEPRVGTLASGISELELSTTIADMGKPGGVITWTGKARGKYVIVQQNVDAGELILTDVVITIEDKNCVDYKRLDGWDITRLVLLCIGTILGFGGSLASFIDFLWARCCCLGTCRNSCWETDVRYKTKEYKQKEKAIDTYRDKLDKDLEDWLKL